MANLSIYGQFLRAPKSVDDYDREARASQLEQLQLLDAQDKRAATQRAVQRQQQLQALMSGLPAGATDADRLQALRGGAFFDQADALEKSMLDREKTRSTVAETDAKTRKSDYDLQRQKYEHRIAGLRQFNEPEDARQWLADSVQSGAMSMKEAQGMMAKVPRDPAGFATWRDGTLLSLLDAAKQAGFVMPDANAKLSASTQLATNKATNDRLAAEGAADRASREGIASADRTAANQRSANSLAAAEKRGKGTGAMSPTLQKELIEADDMVQQAQGAVGMLNQALTLNDKAYSGYGAKQRAQVRANLGGKSENADATIELDNLIGTQALSSLKAIFGGNPTEGERAILLDLQASVEKTPKQRKAIIERGLAAAKRRIQLSGDRASAIRSGKYLTEGAGDDGTASDGVDPVAAAGGDDPLGIRGRNGR